MIHFDNLSDNLLMVSFCLRVYREGSYSERGYRLHIVRFDSRSQFLSGTRRDKNPRRKTMLVIHFWFSPAIKTRATSGCP